MNRRIEIAVVYLAGLAQGLALVVVPAASALLTSPRGYGLTGAAYGALFVPMVFGAIVAASGGGFLAMRWGLKRLFLGGVLLDAVAMALVALSAAFAGRHALAYGVLLAAMLALGGGFGAALTALNSLAPGLFPHRVESALTALHTLLGTGTALAPILVMAASGGGWWWIPAVVAAALVLLGLAGWAQPLAVAAPAAAEQGGGPFAVLRAAPARLWGFVAAAALYGICETLFGNWVILYAHGERGFALRIASYALACFWAAVTLGRLLIAVLAVWLPPRWLYRALPLLLVAAFLVVSRAASPGGSIAAFALAGLACSAMLPLTIGFGEERYPRLAELLGGELIAAYMIGYGIASFGVGPLVDSGVARLGGIYAGASLLAAALLVLSFPLTRVASRGPCR